MMRVKRIVAATLTCCMLSGPLFAQGGPTTPSDAERWHTLISQLEPAAVVRVRLADGHRLKGTLVRVETDGFVVKPHTRIPVPLRSIRFDTVESLERTRIGMSPGMKVVVGVATGVGGYLLLVLAVLANAD